MSWLRKYPGFVGSALVLGLVLLGEGVGLVRTWRVAHGVAKQLEAVTREYQTLVATRPPATAGNAAQIEADGARMADALATLRAGMTGTGAVAERLNRTSPPAHRPDAFFDIATFVEAMRSRAQRAGVALLPDERFGFSAYANEAPELAQIAGVDRERLIVQYLVEALLEAKPHQLLAVQRERPAESAPGGTRGIPGAVAALTGKTPGAAAKDYFDLDPRVSLRVPSIVTTTAFRLSFTGHTAALRGLLNKLGEFELPLIVRSVEVVPAESSSGSPALARAVPALLVAPAWSRFVVTVEFVELASPASANS